jgi:hypothetical protein
MQDNIQGTGAAPQEPISKHRECRLKRQLLYGAQDPKPM